MQEAEAAAIGAELLLPNNAALRAAWAEMSDAPVADLFDISVQLAAWRMNSTLRLLAREAAGDVR